MPVSIPAQTSFYIPNFKYLPFDVAPCGYLVRWVFFTLEECRMKKGVVIIFMCVTYTDW